MHTHYGLDSREEESQATGKDCRPSLKAQQACFGGRAGGLGKGVQWEAIKDVQRVLTGCILNI